MTNREKLQENYEDSVFALLMDEFAESEGTRYIEENERLQHDPDAAVPQELEKRALQLIDREFARRNRPQAGGRLLRFLGRIAIAAGIAALLFVAAYALSPSVRAGTMNFLAQVDERIATWQFVSEDAENPNAPINIDVRWLPDGYRQEAPSIASPMDTMLDCTNGAGGVIRVSAHESIDFMHTLDLEDADYYREIVVQGCEGMLRMKDDSIRIAWPYQNTELVVTVISADVDMDTLLQVAENISVDR